MSDKNIIWSIAPEWADRIMISLTKKYFCNVSQFVEVGRESCAPALFGQNSGLWIGDLEIYQIRPIAPVAKEWDGKGLPPENIQCLVELASRWGKDKKACITGTLFNSVDGEKRLCEVDGEWFDGFESQFYPLKSKEDKELELFIDAALMATNSDKEDWCAIGMFKDMFDAGFTAPKEGE